MREARYKIKKETTVYSGCRTLKGSLSFPDVQENLLPISLAQLDNKYFLPGFKTSVTLTDSDKEISVDIRTSKRGKVEKSLINFLDSYSAKFIGGHYRMRKQDFDPDYDD